VAGRGQSVSFFVGKKTAAGNLSARQKRWLLRGDQFDVFDADGDGDDGVAMEMEVASSCPQYMWPPAE